MVWTINQIPLAAFLLHMLATRPQHDTNVEHIHFCYKFLSVNSLQRKPSTNPTGTPAAGPTTPKPGTAFRKALTGNILHRPENSLAALLLQMLSYVGFVLCGTWEG